MALKSMHDDFQPKVCTLVKQAQQHSFKYHPQARFIESNQGKQTTWRSQFHIKLNTYPLVCNGDNVHIES